MQNWDFSHSGTKKRVDRNQTLTLDQANVNDEFVNLRFSVLRFMVRSGVEEIGP